MSINKSKNFVKYLDTYVDKEQVKYEEYLEIVSNISKDYNLFFQTKDVNSNSYMNWQKQHLTDIKIKVDKNKKKTKFKAIETDIKNATLTCVKNPSCNPVKIIRPPRSESISARGACSQK